MARTKNNVMTMPPDDELGSIWTEKTQKPDKSFDEKYWRKIFITSCFFAVLVDPLFLYVPIVMDDFKCLMLDPKLKIVVLLLRSFTDLFYLMDIIIRIYRFENYSSGLFNELDDRQNQMNFSFGWKSRVRRIAKTIRASIDILIDFVALLPLPQVAILIFFSKMIDLRYMTKTRMVIMNVFALSQYMPRVLRIYLSFMELKRTPKEKITETSIWIKGVLNFAMYIMASHVLGAMWYFFAIQRMMRCWHFACRKDDGCDNRIFRCHDHHAFRNTTILNDLCPLISSDIVPFNFGIFATVLQYGIVGSTNYFQKFSNCFWWGLQNLSSFGSNLHPSADGWENLYTALVSIIGLLLFLYLIGNLQMYMQIAGTRTEDHKHRLVMKQKRKQKGREIELLLFKTGIATSLNKNIKARIMGKVKQALYDSMYADLDDIFPLLPSEVQSRIKEPLAWLKQVPIFREMDEVVLKKIYEHLEPVKYNENIDIIQKGQPLDKMIFIVDGELCDSYSTPKLYGEELLRWPFSTSFPHTKPLATESVKAILTKNKNKKSVKENGVVEALALKACDLESIYMQPDTKRREEPRHKKMMKNEIKQHMNSWMRKNGIPERLNNDIKLRIMKNLTLDYWDTLPFDWYDLVSRLPSDFQNEIKRYMPLTKLQQMSAFQNMDESVLKKICSHLRHMKYDDGKDIIAKGDTVQTLFIVDGYISDQSLNEKGPGEIYGEELLVWPFLTSFPHNLPTVAESPFAEFEFAEVLVLKSMYMERIATEFRKHFIKNYGKLVRNLVNYVSPVGTTPAPSSSEAAVRFFTEEEIQEATSNYSCHNYVNEGGYGTVYEAALHGRAVAIKTCNTTTGDQFIQSQHLVHEAFVLSQIRHNNVVRLLGCCLKTEWPIMVYNRTCARTLYEHIHMKGPKFLLESRMKIAAETAGALAYLHSMLITHRDVKTTNILIDHTTHTAKVSGFGASRLLHENEGEMEYVLPTLAKTRLDDDDDDRGKTEDKASTLPESSGEDEVSTLPKTSGEDEVSTLPERTGYLDPEYLESHVLTEKSDIFSFGVVLVELLTSQEAVSSDGPDLANAFVCSVQEGRLDQILDGQVIRDNFTIGIAKKVSKIAVTCLKPRGKERPSMKDVAAKLDRVVQTIMNREKPCTVENKMSSASRTSK